MNNHTHRPLGAGHDHLFAMPAEILHEIFKHVLQTPSQQVLPNPLSVRDRTACIQFPFEELHNAARVSP